MYLQLLFPPSLGDLRATARAELLESWFGRWLGQKVEVQVAESYRELDRRLAKAEVDIAWAPPLICAKAEARARAILKAVRSGRSSYRAALVAREERKLEVSATSLRGLTAAWVDPLSTGGYLLPVAHLRERGCDPDRVLGGQLFLGSYRATLCAVLNGDADLGPIYTPEPDGGATQAAMSECVGPERSRLVPFAYTSESPNDGLVITERLSAAAAEVFIRRLTPFAAGAHGPNLLLAVLGAERLERAEAGEYAKLVRLPLSGP